LRILALDLGKFNTMCCFFDSKSRKHSFLNAATERNYLNSLFTKHKVGLVDMGACGPSGWMNDLAISHGLKPSSAPPIKTLGSGPTSNAKPTKTMPSS
jgi:transposase